MPHLSKHPDIDLPTDVAVWSWLFESTAFQAIEKLPANRVGGVTNAISKKRLSYKEIKQLSIYLSTALVKVCGIKEGNTVALFSPNSIWYPVAMHAALRAGFVIAGASPSYSVEEITHCLQVSQAKVVMTVPESLQVALKAAKNVGIPQKNVILLEGSASGHRTLQQLVDIGKSFGEERQISPYVIPRNQQNNQVCGFLSFSSGTTGKPKALMISHQNVIAQCLQMKQITAPDYEKVFAVLPLFHITGLVHLLHLPVVLNAEVVMLPKFDMKTMLECIVEYQFRELVLVPPILIRLVQDKVVDQYDLSCIRRFSSGAGPLPDSIIQLLKSKFPGTGFKQGYGMTESCSCLTAHSPSIYDYKYAHTVGTIVPSTQLKFVDAAGMEGDAGEILAKGPQCAMGYLNNPQADKESFDEEGWLHTGDQGLIDKNGVVTITGRLKDIIKVKGTAVSPAELEELLLRHEKILDAAVIGIPDFYSGEVPKAYVVLKSGVGPSETLRQEIISYVKERRVRVKWLADVEFIQEIPKQPSGKILRRVLQDMAKRSGSEKKLHKL